MADTVLRAQGLATGSIKAAPAIKLALKAVLTRYARDLIQCYEAIHLQSTDGRLPVQLQAQVALPVTATNHIAMWAAATLVELTQTFTRARLSTHPHMPPKFETTATTAGDKCPLSQRASKTKEGRRS